MNKNHFIITLCFALIFVGLGLICKLPPTATTTIFLSVFGIYFLALALCCATKKEPPEK